MSESHERRVLVLAHEPDGTGGQVTVRLRQRGFDVDTHVVTTDYERPNNSAPFPPLSEYDLLVPMGSVRYLTQKDEIDTWIYDEIAMVREAHQSGVPVLGVCFGGQLIAEALGGSVESSPTSEIGWYRIDDGDETNPVGPGPWMQWHHDRFIPPPQAAVLARNENAVQLFRLGATVGSQFHPEVDVAHVEGWLAMATDEYLAEYGQNRTDILAAVHANEAANIAQCHRLVDWFLDEVAFADEPGAT
ncbi:MAG: type 1 glutamine amidotransferase [Acidimicrobiales bacterium]